MVWLVPLPHAHAGPVRPLQRPKPRLPKGKSDQKMALNASCSFNLNGWHKASRWEPTQQMALTQAVLAV